MKNSLLLIYIYAFVKCLAQGVDPASGTVSALEGANMTLTCVTTTARLEPPPGCVWDWSSCLAYREPRKYLCRDGCQKPIIETYTDEHRDQKYLLVYEKNPGTRVLRLTIFGLMSEDTGMYTCGLYTPSGLHRSSQYMVLVNTIQAQTTAAYDDKIYFPALFIQSGFSLDKNIQTEAGMVVRAEEGKDITVECPLEHLEFAQPPSRCFQDKGQCFHYFQPLKYLVQERGPRTVVETFKDYGENGRFSLRYEGKLLTVGVFNLSKVDSGRYVCGAAVQSGKNATWTFEVIVEDAVAEGDRRLLLLLLVPALLLLTGGGVSALVFYKKRNSNSDAQGANTSQNIGDAMYENLPAPVPPPADSTYQTLSLDTMDHNQVYSTLESPRPSQSMC